ncbi:FAD-dependent oxidoreductase [Saccharibacillus brassicae]|uniref:NAD(P)/FAD-dependent oxidoreductase n=1 Tax=Saccharibacillus brassicae TaxID=2583377 RepID=A0A4Y6V1Y0_SACBS|nr:FAD-dependent oxidoreductase [Saccharibacillus brassicae]QDH22770.1 NAD(P)/FAD-dependent oxidoreductase [Saccharibacillus brassicae]
MSEQKPKLVVIGNGMAGIRCLEEILKLAPDRFEMTVIGEERHPNYNRMMLSKVLQGHSSFDEIVLNPYEWYREHGIALHTGERAVRIRTGARREVETASGLSLPWDRLIIATGSSAFVPPIPGADKSGVIAFRNLEDCSAMIRASGSVRRAAVIGGGLLGLEAARGLLNLGMDTQVVHNAPFLMNRQLDETAAKLLRKELESQGMRFRLNTTTTAITGLNRVKGLRFADGGRMETELVVLAVGITPNTELAADSGIAIRRGIVVDDSLQTNMPGVYAVGECAEHRGIAYGLVAPLYEQAKVLANRLCGASDEPYVGSTLHTRLKVAGVDVFSAGEIREDQAEVAQRTEDGLRGLYRKVTMQGGRIVGAILYGDTAESTSLLKLIARQASVDTLVSGGEAGTKAGGGMQAAAAALQGGEQVCACNEVSKDSIVQAVVSGGLSSADQVKRATGASGSCGGCRPMVEALVEYAKSGAGLVLAGEAAAEAPDSEEALCGCVPFGRAGLKAAAEAVRPDYAPGGPGFARGGVPGRGVHLIPEREWAGGCDICRPAVLYYWQVGSGSGAREDEAGGARRYSMREAGIEGRAEPAGMFAPADAEAEAARRIGEHLARSLRAAALPGPVDAAVSAGPDDPRGIAVRDIGLGRCPAGWELYAGGHAEHPVRAGEWVGVAGSEEEAALLGEALLQLYREQAFYGEALWEWFERFGLRSVREILLDRTLREELAWRLAEEANAESAAY